MTAEECVFKTDGNVDIKPSSVLHDEGGVSIKPLESLIIFREAGNAQDPAHYIIHLSTFH